ncbi:MAG: alpha/beta hydrolase [Candidatus Eremiobacteraeota bacterium]|nr:alpha/beta hydrolase [Candidatus Eremiobacteraeota bacterium]
MNIDRVEGFTDWPTGTDLRGYRCVPDVPLAVVLVLHGFGEYAGRHATTMRAWAARGIAAYAYDHRGHGHSPGERAEVERFDDLVTDSLAIRDRVAAEHPALALFLFGVSMGGVVAVRSVQRRGDGVRGVVLLAPAFAAAEHIPPLARRILRGVRKIAPKLKLQSLEFSKLSRDPAVGEAYRNDPLTYHSGVSISSGIEIVDAGEAAVADAGNYTVATLLLQGDADEIAFPIGATRFARAATNNSDLTHTIVTGGYHELFNDPGGTALAASAADWMLARVSSQAI